MLINNHEILGMAAQASSLLEFRALGVAGPTAHEEGT